MKKLRYTVLSIILALTIHYSCAQNLVPNGSFEVYDTCPTNINGALLRYADFWVNPTAASPDYFNACDVSGGHSVPLNIISGYQQAFEGSAYCALIMYADSCANCREYAQVQLSSSLQVDSCYRLSFYVSLTNYGDRYKITNWDAYFSSTAISSTSMSLLSYSPQFVYTDLSGIGDTSSWYLVEGIIQAQGGENFLTIGNFHDDANTTKIINNLSSIYAEYAYYLIDSASLIKVTCPIDIGVEENQNVTILNVFPNPVASEITIEFELSETNNVSIEIKNVLGQTIKTISISFTKGKNKIEIDVSEFSSGIYSVKLQSDDYLLSKKFLKQ